MKCDCCGKFRKLEDCTSQQEDGNEGQGKEYIECRFCMSDFDAERYGFKTLADGAHSAERER